MVVWENVWRLVVVFCLFSSPFTLFKILKLDGAICIYCILYINSKTIEPNGRFFVAMF